MQTEYCLSGFHGCKANEERRTMDGIHAVFGVKLLVFSLLGSGSGVNLGTSE